MRGEAYAGKGRKIMSKTANTSVNLASETSVSVSDPHAMRADDVLEKMRSQRDGLSGAEAANRLTAVGPNRLPEPPKEGLFKRYFKHFNDILIYILVAAGVAKAFLGHWVDACVILAVAGINAIVGFIPESQTHEGLDGIRQVLPLRGQQRRANDSVALHTAALVPAGI